MKPLLNFMFEANLLLLVCWLIYTLGLRQDTSFQFRRFFILCLLIAVPIIPFLNISLSETVSGPTLVINQVVMLLPELVVGEGEKVGHFLSGSPPWVTAIIVLYVLVALFLAFRFGQNLGRIRGMINDKSNTRTITPDYVLIEATGYPTFSFFRYLVLDQSQNFSQEERQQVLDHEKIHIKEWHTVDLILLEMAKAVFWFNPAVWALSLLQRENHEYIADQKVTQRHSKSSYQRLIARMSLGATVAYANNLAQLDTIKRFKMMDSKAKPEFRLNQAMALTILVMTMGFLACTEGALQDVTQETSIEAVASPEASRKMEALATEFPGVHFTYDEVDLPEGGFEPSLIKQHDASVQDYIIFEDRQKVGLVLLPNDQFTKMAELTRDEKGNYSMATEFPQPEEGMAGFFSYVSNNLKYPELARKLGIEGKVFVEFVVDEKGEVIDVLVLSGVGAGCDEAAATVVANSPPWNPGKLGDKPVRVRMVLPITFKLNADG